MSEKRAGLLIIFLLVLVLVIPAFGTSQSGEKHTLSIQGLETKDNYLGLSYVKIISKSNGSLVYKGYVMNRTMILQEDIDDGFSMKRQEELNETIKISFYDFNRGSSQYIDLYIPKDANFTFGKSIDIGDDKKKLVSATWNLTEGKYIIKGEGYTNEDERRYEEIDKEYPDFTDEKEIDLDSDREVSLFFVRDEELPWWAGAYIFLKEFLYLPPIVFHLISSLVALVYFNQKMPSKDDLDFMLTSEMKKKLYISSLIPIIAFFVVFFSFLIHLFVYSYIPPGSNTMSALSIFLFYSGIIFLISGLYMGLKKFRLGQTSYAPPEVMTLLGRVSKIYILSFIFSMIMSFLSYLMNPSSACYAPAIKTWTPEVPKNILIFPLILRWLRKKKLKKKLKEEGIYREEWDDI